MLIYLFIYLNYTSAISSWGATPPEQKSEWGILTIFLQLFIDAYYDKK